MASDRKMWEQWKDWRLTEVLKKVEKEDINEHTVVFSKDEMEKLHREGKLVKTDPDGKEHTYIYSED